MPNNANDSDARPLNIRQQRFCELVVSGMSATQAYIAAGYNVDAKSAGTAGPRLLENVAVKAQVAAMRAKDARKSEFTRENLAAQLIAAYITPVGAVDENSPLAEEVIRTTVVTGTGKNKRTETRVRVKMMGKLQSGRLLCDMYGWKEPEQLVVETGPKTLDAIKERAQSVVSALDRTLSAVSSKSA